MGTKIEWADEVWNPVTGCTKVSQGCVHCYAERFARRQGYDFSQVEVHMERMLQPLHWKKPRRVFVNSMSDLFHEEVPGWIIWDILETAMFTERHIFMILTKRPERMMKYMSLDYWRTSRPPNVWLGVSMEDQATADERIPLLLKTPAAVRFVSYEPALGAVDLHLTPRPPSRDGKGGIDWVICGGESGPGARAMDPDWARSVRDQCKEAGVAFFMKQMGGWPNKRGGARPGDIPEDLLVREWPGLEGQDEIVYA